MRYALVCAVLACGGARTERVSVAPVPLPASPQPTASGALAPPAPTVAGTYELDHAATRPYLDEQIAKMPQDQQQFAALGIAMFEKMQATLLLTDDGQVTLTMRMDDEKDKEKTTGTWRREGAAIVLARNGGKDMRCTIDGAHLLCSERPNDTMVFTRR